MSICGQFIISFDFVKSIVSIDSINFHFSILISGGLIILVVIRTIQHNMLKMRDRYLHTNCLAALANMSSQFKNLHPYVCHRILALFEALSKRYYRVVSTLQSMDNFTDEDKERSCDVAADAAALEEVLRMVLEIINSTLISQSKSNSNFIYTLLYHQHIFEPFQKHPNFQDLLQNIVTVIEFYNKKLEPMKEEGSFGVNEMQDFIKQTAIQFPTDKLKVLFTEHFGYFCQILETFFRFCPNHFLPLFCPLFGPITQLMGYFLGYLRSFLLLFSPVLSVLGKLKLLFKFSFAEIS